MVGWRVSEGERPLGRVGGIDEDEGFRCASKYGAGESFAYVAGGKESADVVAMMCTIEVTMKPGDQRRYVWKGWRQSVIPMLCEYTRPAVYCSAQHEMQAAVLVL